MSDFKLKSTVTYTPRGDFGRFIAAIVTPGVIASVAAAQGLIVQEAKSLVPVRSGDLRDSIEPADPQETGNTVIGAVVAGMPYAAYVEYGTGIRGSQSSDPGPYPYSGTWPGMNAQPYLRPALDTTRDAVREIFRSQLSIALKV